VPASGPSGAAAATRRPTSAPRRARNALLRVGYRVAYRLLAAYAYVLRPRARGVKCVLTHGDDVVLVRHNYGPRRMWQLPGGGMHRGESPLATARREMREELGIEGVDFHLLTTLELELVHRRVMIAGTHAELTDTALDPDPVEIAEARFFAHDALPRPISAEVLTLVELAFSPAATGRRMGE